MKRSFIYVILILLFPPLIAQSTSPWPGVHDYQSLDQQAIVLNLEKVKRKIRVPVSALREQRVLNMHCRVLVNQHGAYVRHVFTRIDHEDLLGPVSIQVANLAFVPARREQKNVPSWVNVVFRFFPKRETLQQHSTFRESLLSGFRRDHLSPETSELLQAHLQERRWEEALAYSSVLIEDYGKRLRKHHPEQLIFLYLSRAEALLSAGLPESAHLDLNTAICLRAEHQLDDFSSTISALRILSGIASDHQGTRMEDFRQIQSDLTEEKVWKIWFPILLSGTFRASLPQVVFDQPMGHPQTEEIMTIIQGLNALDRHDFHEALFWMNRATQFGLPQSLHRELSHRIAESLRQTDQQPQALNICEELLETQPLDPFTHYLKGIILLDIGATEDGNESLQRSILLGLDPENRSKAISLLQP